MPIGIILSYDSIADILFFEIVFDENLFTLGKLS